MLRAGYEQHEQAHQTTIIDSTLRLVFMFTSSDSSMYKDYVLATLVMKLQPADHSQYRIMG